MAFPGVGKPVKGACWGGGGSVQEAEWPGTISDGDKGGNTA